MKRTSRTLLVTAAVGGLISGAVIQQAQADPTNAAPGKVAVAPGEKVPTVHGCAGLNECKGLGGCESVDKKFKNSCKAKGGCEITEADIKTWKKKQKEDADKAAARETVKQTPKPAGP